MKKGQAEAQQLMLITEFILGIVVVMTLMYSAYQFSNNDQFVKQYISKDVAMMMDTVMGVQGDLEISIPLEKTRNIEIGKNKEFNYYRVLVDDDRNSEAVFAGDEKLFVGNTILEANVVKIIKEGDNVKIVGGSMSELGVKTTETGKVGCGFDESKLGLYKSGDKITVKYRGSGSPDSFIQEVLSENGKEYAINVLKIEGIKHYSKEEMENLIRAEVAKKWGELERKGWDTHGSTEEDAQRAVLSYAEHETGLLHFRENGKPINDVNTLGVLSITPDKGSYKNQFYAFAWDVRYNIFVGVDEIFNAFKNSAMGEGLERWHDAVGYVFLPSNRNRYWTDSRSSVAKQAWENYKNEKAYVC